MVLLQQVHRDCVNNRERFHLRYQPIVKAQTGLVTGAEALIRWETPEYGEVSPSRFISFLENDPAYAPLGLEILRTAVRQAGIFMRSLPDFRINVNITALQLNEERFVSDVLRILDEEHFPPDHLILELTERCKEMEFSFLKEQVRQLQEAGIRVALDDMGTGYSTIDLLLHMNADEVKLDMTFTQEMRGNENAELLARVLCEAAARRGTELCFEGVETRDMMEYLKQYGNVLLQGYYFDRPLLPDAFSARYCKENR
jgi:EAL domain-containing protein (putative c-di-GMP-specific phosphodiesterase class I)